ncbi:MAG: rRNA ((1402)-2-O)-methyltransferase [Pseudomonadota bacterium]
MKPGMYIVATPIGNLDDITLRALQVLKDADLVAAEDTRHSRKLLQYFGIERALVAYHEHSDLSHIEAKFAEVIESGGTVALISDAGTPLVSDPGYPVVRAMQNRGLAVVPVPGPSAAIAAISVAGLASDRFTFAGFPPAKETARRGWYADLAHSSATLIIYEAPHRVLASLRDAIAVFGAEREACMCREITKTFETIKRACLADLAEFVAADTNQQRGEIVLIIAGSKEPAVQLGDAEEALLLSVAEYAPPKVAAGIVADYLGLKKNDLYARLLEIKNKV